MNNNKKLQYILDDLKIALEKSNAAENSSDLTISYAILKSSVIAKITDLEMMVRNYE